MKKAYGFMTMRSQFCDYVYGLCVTEDGTVLGGWTSSDIDFLKTDLANHAIGYEYEFLDKIPEWYQGGLNGL